MGTDTGTGRELTGLDALRAVARNTPPAPAELEPYLAKVHRAAYTITDADVDELTAAGFSEDVIFEQTVAVAIAEGLYRLDAAERVL
jgi:alkylhydroperoxidase family enzyme